MHTFTLKRIYVLMMTLLVAMFSVSACNTTRGVGQDIEATGEAIEEAAEEAKDEMD